LALCAFLFDDESTFSGDLALQLPFCFEVGAPCDCLVSSAPDRPCDDVCWLDALSSEPDGDAPNFLD
jgi:hypothetical protein